VAGDGDFIYGYGWVAAATPTRLAVLAADGHASDLTTPVSLPWVSASGYDAFGVATPVASASGTDTAFGYGGELTVGGDVYLPGPALRSQERAFHHSRPGRG
jgi:hypothetical protein